MRPGFWVNTGTAVAMLAAALVSGCAGEAEPRSDGGVDTVAFDDPNAIPVQGQVVDDEFVPTDGVDVNIDPTGQTATTADGGLFRFAVLEPGLYTFSVFAVGFEGMEEQIDIPAEGKTDVVLTIKRTAEGVPYQETQTYVSYSFCHGPIGGGCFLVNTITSTNTLPEDRPDFGYEIPNNGFKELRFEAEWSGANVGPGGFLARNPEGLFLGCNNTNPEPYEPTVTYYRNNNPDGSVNNAGDPNPEREPSPVQMWIQAGEVNTEVGGCVPMPSEKGHKLWQTVRISPSEPLESTVGCCAVDVRANLWLTFFFWDEAEDRAFTMLEQA